MSTQHALYLKEPLILTLCWKREPKWKKDSKWGSGHLYIAQLQKPTAHSSHQIHGWLNPCPPVTAWNPELGLGIPSLLTRKVNSGFDKVKYPEK